MPEPESLEARVRVLETLLVERDRLYTTKFGAAEIAVSAALAAQQAKMSFGFAIVSVIAALTAIIFGLKR